MSLSVNAFNLALYARHAWNTRKFRKRVGHWPNYVEPRTFNEKIQWRKLFDRNPLFPIFCDKLAARNYVMERTPTVRLPEVLWVGTDPREIPYESLPEQYVIKPNHRSGRNYFVRSKADIVPKLIVEKMRHSLRHPHGPRVREWGYQRVEGRVFVERMLDTDSEANRTRDFRFHVFDGRSEVVIVELADVTTSKRTVLPYDVFYDRDWRQLPYRRYRKTELSQAVAIPRPPHFDKLVAAAETLARGLDYARVDLFLIGDEVWFGEITLYAGSGFNRYSMATSHDRPDLQGFDIDLGLKWHLPQVDYGDMLRRGLIG